MNVMKKLKTILFFIFLYLAITSQVFAQVPSIPGREANDWEYTYLGVAVELGVPELCYKIYEKAYGTAGFNPEGYQAKYYRSECLQDIAVNTKNPQLCNDIVTINAGPFLNGSKYSKENCLQKIERGYDEGTATFGYNKTQLFSKLGYTKDDWDADIKSAYEQAVQESKDPAAEEELAWIQYYIFKIQHDEQGLKKFKERLAGLPAFTE